MSEQGKKLTGGSAFPQSQTVTDGCVTHAADYDQGGMTLRDWFAGQTLHGLTQNWPNTSNEHLAQRACELADAMLYARDLTP